MKKISWKGLICTGLALAMTAGLCACGGDGDGGGSGRKGASSDPELAKQGVYSWEEFQMPDFGTEDYNIHSVASVDNKIYMLVNSYDWEADPAEKYYLVSANMEGGDVQYVPLQTSMDGAEGDGDGNPAGDGTEAGGAGAASSEAASEAEPATEEAAPEESVADDSAVDAEKPPLDTEEPVAAERYENTYFGSFMVSPEGVIYGTKNHYLEDYTDPENPIYEDSSYMCGWDLEGRMLWEKPLDWLQTEESYSYINKMAVMPDGQLEMVIGGDRVGIVTVDKEGGVSDLKEFNPDEKIFENMQDVYLKADGTVVFSYVEENAETYSPKLATYDPETGTVTDGIEMPGGMTYNYYNMQPGLSTDFIYTTSDGIYTYNLGDTESKQMMSYVNSDLVSRNLNNIVELDQESFVAFYNDNETYKTVGGIFTRVDPKDIPDKKVLVLAGEGINYSIMSRVVEFNKGNDEYRIVVKDYSQYATYEDYMAGINQLSSDILAGNMPDILLMNQSMPIERYVSKGLLADVGKLIEQDEELSQVEFMENVLEAYKVDGKLYEVIPSFNVRTMIAKTSLVGERASWTVSDLRGLLDTLPEETELISGMTQEAFLGEVLQYCGNDFVDVSTGKCDFTSQNFIDLLELAATLPKAAEGEEGYDDEYWQQYWENYYTQYREERTLLEQCYIGSVRELNYNINGEFGEDVSFVGFPTDSGQGSIIYTNNDLVISAKSANQDGAWQFVRYYLTDEYQDTLTYGLPIRKDRFMELAAEATKKPTYEDENGNLVEYDETFWMNDESIPLDPLSQAQVDQIVEVLSSVNKKQYYNEDVQNIVTEEAAAFFSGQKSAQDVANVIQSRVQLYVNENR